LRTFNVSHEIEIVIDFYSFPLSLLFVVFCFLFQPPARSAYEYRPGPLATGFDAAPAGMYTLAAAEALCTSLPTCAGFTFASSSPTPSGQVMCSFKHTIFWAPGSGQQTYTKVLCPPLILACLSFFFFRCHKICHPFISFFSSFFPLFIFFSLS
jgi:hypothetical protein